MEKDNRQTITLADSDGKEFVFELAFSVTLNENDNYAVFTPLDEFEMYGLRDALVFKIEVDEDGEEGLRMIIDDDIIEEVIKECVNIYNQDK